MRGYRKFALGLGYLVSVTWIAHRLIAAGVKDLTSLGLFATGMATGVGVIVWGNVQNYRADKAKPPEGTPSP